MSTQPENLSTPAPTGTTSSKRDFWIGFIGWWFANLCATGALFAFTFGLPSLVPGSSDYAALITTITNSLGCLVLLANIGVLIFFAFRRKQIALGILVAFGVALGITLLIGVIATVACFVILGQYSSGG
jgi:hypothetical protein